MRYSESTIDSRILRAVSEMGYEEMTPIQELAIPVFMEGKDLIGQAQTGTGKTASFGIPMIQKINPDNKEVQAIVLCPTRELAIQAANELRSFAKYYHGVKILPIYGGQDITKQIRMLKGVQIVVGTPGRVMDHMRRHTLKLQEVRMVVLDEADEMLNMGFREDMETILSQTPEDRQTALFSATMPKAILEIAATYQKEDTKEIKVAAKELTIPLVKQFYYEVRNSHKNEAACRILSFYTPKRTLIFCNTKKGVDELSEVLKERGYRAEGLHGDLTQFQRDTVMKHFRSGSTDVLIATDVAARGIDIEGVEAVINYDLPQDIEYYVHRIGRTGRAGKEGTAFTFIFGKEFYKLKEIEHVCKTKIDRNVIPSVKSISQRNAKMIMEHLQGKTYHSCYKDALLFIKEAVELTEISAEEYAAILLAERMEFITNQPEEIDDHWIKKEHTDKYARSDRRRNSDHFYEKKGKRGFKDGKELKKEYHREEKDGRRRKRKSGKEIVRNRS